MANSQELDGEPAACRRHELIIDLTARFYGFHTHNGRAYVSLEHSMRMAATIVGAAESQALLNVVEGAQADPNAALSSLRRSQETVAESIDAERQRQMKDWAAAFKGGAPQ